MYFCLSAGPLAASNDIQACLAKSEAEVVRRSLSDKVELRAAKRDGLPWPDVLVREFYSNNPPIQLFSEIRKKLKRSKHYWCFYYDNREAGKGGDLTIFIDEDTLAVIAVLQGR